MRKAIDHLFRRLRFSGIVLSRGSSTWAPAGWEDQELVLIERLADQLKEELTLAVDAEAVAFDIMKGADVAGTNLSLFRAHASLLVRCQRDLRATVLSALHGLTMQAWGTAASCYEAGHTAGFIGDDVSRADRWLAHDNLEAPFTDAYAATIGTFKFLELAPNVEKREEMVKLEHRFYKTLCAGKHANPQAERLRSVHDAPGGPIVYFTPTLTTGAMGEARLGIGLATRTAIMCTWVYAKALGVSMGVTEANSPIVRLLKRSSELLPEWSQDVRSEDDAPASS